MITIVQFSPTGNSAYLAKELAAQLNIHGVLPLEHTNPESITTEHLVVFYPIHAFNPPGVVKQFVNGLSQGKIKYVSLIAVGCNTVWINHAVSIELRQMIEKKSMTVLVDEIMAMPLSFVMSFPDDLIKEQLELSKNKLKEIATNINGKRQKKREIKFKSHLLHFLGKAEPLAARFFGLELHAKKSCIQCGLCVKECGNKNIQMTNEGKINFGFKCMMCMRCIYNCPTQSITPRISKFIPAKGGYALKNHL